MIVACLFILIGIILLVYGADKFVDGAAGVAYLLGVPPLIIGLVIVGFATSAPEILVGSVSAWQNKTPIAIGNALGSNIANIGLVLGVSLLMLPMTVKSAALKNEYLLMCVAIILALLLMLDGYLSRMDALVLLVALAVTIGLILWLTKKSTAHGPLTTESASAAAEKYSMGSACLQLLIGIVALLGGAELLVNGAVSIAIYYGLADLIIGLTIIAVGTSLPELAASIMSLIKKKSDIAIGNIIGSNMFNILAVLSIPALINPDYFPRAVIVRDFPVMMLLTLSLGVMIFILGRDKLSRIEGGLLLFVFISYQFTLFMQSHAI